MSNKLYHILDGLRHLSLEAQSEFEVDFHLVARLLKQYQFVVASLETSGFLDATKLIAINVNGSPYIVYELFNALVLITLSEGNVPITYVGDKHAVTLEIAHQFHKPKNIEYIITILFPASTLTIDVQSPILIVFQQPLPSAFSQHQMAYFLLFALIHLR